MVVSPRWLIALTLGLVVHATPAHAAGWTEPVTLPGAQEQISDRMTLLRFDAAGRGVAEWSNGGSASISRTSDGGSSWTTGVTPQFVPSTIAVAFDGAGNRVYAYVASSNIRIVRTDSGGAPNATTFKNVPANARSLSLAVNPAGDVLVAWTSDNTTDETGIAFWAHDKADPDARQLQPTIAGASNATPFAALDPSRFAVVAYQQDGKLVQTQSDDAGTAPFGPPTLVSSGNVGGMRGAQAPDGRAIIGYATNFNRGPSLPCADTLGNQTTRVAVAQITATGEGAFTAQQLAGGGNVNSYEPRVAAGPDGRLAASWRATVGCGNANDISVAGAAFAGPEHPLSVTVPGAPRFLGALAFLPDGRLAALSSTSANASGPLASIVFDPSVPVEQDPPPDTSTPPSGDAGPPPATTVTPAPVKPATATLGTLKTRKDGTLKLTVKASGAGKLLLEAFAKKSLLAAVPPKGTSRVGVTTATVKVARTVTLTLRPTGAGKRRLRKTGKLPVTLRLTFTPAGGKAGTPLTRKATLKR